MTDPMMNPRAAMEKSPDADVLREMIGYAAEKLMALEIGVKTGAGFGEKSSARSTDHEENWRRAERGCVGFPWEAALWPIQASQVRRESNGRS